MCGKQRVKNGGFGSVAMIGLRTRFFGCVARKGDRDERTDISDQEGEKNRP
jgi:hypothetical protein